MEGVMDYYAACQEAQECRQWRPIDTAPRDGTFVLVAEDEPDLYGQQVWVVRFEDGEWFYSGCEYSVSVPTRWMPLPELAEMTRFTITPKGREMLK